MREVKPINTVVTSKEEILRTCREMVSENGLAAVNMRTVAKKCNVALGSLYYYFSGKDELVLETIESVWQSIFHLNRPCGRSTSFPAAVKWIFDSVRNSAAQYPNFLTMHSLGVADAGISKAKDTMKTYLAHMESGLAEALKADPAVRKDAFSAAFSETDFLDFVLDSILGLLLQQKKDCRVLLEMIRRTIY
jgi:AcrR family transcriptional regulator